MEHYPHLISAPVAHEFYIRRHQSAYDRADTPLTPITAALHVTNGPLPNSSCTSKILLRPFKQHPSRSDLEASYGFRIFHWDSLSLLLNYVDLLPYLSNRR